MKMALKMNLTYNMKTTSKWNLKRLDNVKNGEDLKMMNTARRDISSAVCASSLYNPLAPSPMYIYQAVH